MSAAVWLLIWGLVSGGSSAFGPQAPPHVSDLSAEELQVIAIALSETGLREARRHGAGRKPVVAVVADSTLATCRESGPKFCIHDRTHAIIARVLGEANERLARTFASRNATASAVPQFEERIALVPAGELEEVFRRPRDGWQEFNRRFGRAGLVRFSAPAIEGDYAVVYVSFGCGPLCGKSWLVTLERRRGRFRVQKSHSLTMS